MSERPRYCGCKSLLVPRAMCEPEIDANEQLDALRILYESDTKSLDAYRAGSEEATKQILQLEDERDLYKNTLITIAEDLVTPVLDPGETIIDLVMDHVNRALNPKEQNG